MRILQYSQSIYTFFSIQTVKSGLFENRGCRGRSSLPGPGEPAKKLSQLLMLSTIIIVIGGGVALLWQFYQESQAAGLSVVGPPTLPAATVDAIFARLGSPMVGTGKVVEQASRQTDVDDAFALGVWWTETNDGAAGVGSADRNPGSVRDSPEYSSAFDGYTIYPSYAAAIVDWFNLLRNRYVNRGLSTVYAIAYPYVGTSSAPLWAGKVTTLMLRYRAEAPPPRPTASPTHVKLVFANGLLTLHSQGQTLENRVLPVRQHAGMSTQQASITVPLSRTTELAIVCFGLLTAIAIALWSLKIGRGVH